MHMFAFYAFLVWFHVSSKLQPNTFSGSFKNCLKLSIT